MVIRHVTVLHTAGRHVHRGGASGLAMLFAPVALEVVIPAERPATFDTEMPFVRLESQSSSVHISMSMSGQGALLGIRGATCFALIVNAGAFVWWQSGGVLRLLAAFAGRRSVLPGSVVYGHAFTLLSYHAKPRAVIDRRAAMRRRCGVVLHGMGECEESSGDPGAQIMQVPYLSENSVVYCSGGVLRAGIARESYPRLMACSTKGTRGRSQTNVRPIYLRDILPAIGIAKRCYGKWRSPERCPNSSSRRRARGGGGGRRRRPMTPKFTAGQNAPIAQEGFHGMFVVC